MSTPIKVFIICSGLGHINRGYESFTQECFDALVEYPALDMTLFKGGGTPGVKQVVLWNLPRNQPFCSWLGKKIGKSGYWVEQVTFTLSLLPYIARQKPDVIYLSDTNIGNMLWHWRQLTRLNYKLLFSNGGPMTPPYPRWDFVQQLTPTHRELALASGYPADQQTLLPYGIAMETELGVLSPIERDNLRSPLNMPPMRPIVLSVGAVNRGHKRMDYVIREIAAMKKSQPYLIILGQQDEDTPHIRDLAENLLGTGNYEIRTVPHSDIIPYYQVSEVFVLASLGEGFGRVFLEAMSQGLPCLTHDYPVAHFVLGDIGHFGDFTQAGSLTALLCQVLSKGQSIAERQKVYQSAFERFSWQQLGSQYVEMLQRCVKS